MKKSIMICSALIVGLLGVSAARADSCNGSAANGLWGNQVQNCSFETGDFTGWSGTTTTEANPGIAGVDGFDPFVGNFEAYMGSNGATETLKQTVATQVGFTYTIEFELMQDTTPITDTNSFLATFGGATLLSQTKTAADGYTLYTYTKKATSASTVLSFTSRNDAGYFDLDSVSVVTSPEPSSFIFLGTGLAGLAGAARRRFNR